MTKGSATNGVNAAINAEKDAFSKLAMMISNLIEFIGPRQNVNGDKTDFKAQKGKNSLPDHLKTRFKDSA